MQNHPNSTRYRQAWIAIGLVALTVLVYSSVGSFGFVNFDDSRYVYENQQVKRGLTWSGVEWAFTTGHAANWHPITWLSHMLDVQLFGLNPGASHYANLTLHVINTLLLYGLLYVLTGASGRSAMVAALFAIHPLHVESVVWISERKDVLSTFFFLMTLFAYTRYTRSPGIGNYVVVLVMMAFGLMTKPMLVTLPFVLLLLDLWPLNRINATNWTWSLVNRLVVEKIPFFLLVLISSFITFQVQKEGGAVVSLDNASLILRLSNSMYSYNAYVGKMFWPVELAVLYPYPESIPFSKAFFSGLLLLFMSLAVILGFRRYPYLSIGWFWFLGVTVPVIGIVQVGSQSMADRYTYIPLIGLFVIIIWGGHDLFGGKSAKRVPLVTLCSVMLVALGVMGWMQTQHWESSETLWRHALAVTSGNFRAHNKLGMLLADKGHQLEAAQHYKKALRIKPHFAFAHNNLGNSLAALGRLNEAEISYRQALAYDSNSAPAHNGLGSVLDDMDEVDQAIIEYNESLKLDPEYAAAYNNLAAAMAKQGRVDDAIAEMQRALQFDSENASYHYNFAMLVAHKEDYNLARKHLMISLKFDPEYQQAREALANLPSQSNDA
jgi:Flp pilus assembly protein TadD